MKNPEQPTNIDAKTVASFGDEWARFDQSGLEEAELRQFFEAYFRIFPWGSLPQGAEGFDMGCGSGRWAKFVAPRVGTLNCVEPSPKAFEVAKRNLKECGNVVYHNQSVDTAPLAPASQDFGYSLGVLHHIPDTEAAMRSCVKLLKPGAPFLVYLYYRFDNRPLWFRALWVVSDGLRKFISRLPNAAKHLFTDTIALAVYWPLSRICKLGERLGLNTAFIPLHAYRNASLYTLRTDSRDRFGTPLEHRFTRPEIRTMMERCGLTNITFSDAEPYWCAVGVKS